MMINLELYDTIIPDGFVYWVENETLSISDGEQKTDGSFNIYSYVDGAWRESQMQDSGDHERIKGLVKMRDQKCTTTSLVRRYSIAEIVGKKTKPIDAPLLFHKQAFPSREIDQLLRPKTIKKE